MTEDSGFSAKIRGPQGSDVTQKQIAAKFQTYPQGSAQLLPGEGACVTFYALRPLERGGHGAGGFLDSTSLRSK